MTTKKYILLIASLLLSTAYVAANKQTLSTIELSVEKGKSYNYPTFALWLESAGGKFVQELYVTQSLATGIYNNADAGDKRWKEKKEKLDARQHCLIFCTNATYKHLTARTYQLPNNPYPMLIQELLLANLM